MSAGVSSYNCEGVEEKRSDMLGMLAEVAAQMNTEQAKSEELEAKKKKARESKRKSVNTQATSYTIAQLLTMPAATLIKLFTVFSGDELKKQYSYACALIPGCTGVFSSFASDAKAKLAIQQHLATHLERWRDNMNSCDCTNFTVTPVSQAKPKSTPPAKRTKTQPKKSPKENLNKENKDTKVGNSTLNNARKGLSLEVNLKELENCANQDMKVINALNSCVSEPKKEVSNVKVLRDHSYYGHVKDDNGNNETVAVNKISVNTMTNENIMVMVVENNGASMSDPINSTVEDIANHINLESNQPESMTLYGEDPLVQPSVILPAKPKGKAKFIGTSEEERSKALERMAKIKKFGNPSGNELMCDICNPPRTFTAPTTLLSHFRSHANIKPFTCEICNAMFTRRHSLKYHMLIHRNLTRFTCADCGKKFRHPSHFREHRRRHTGESPFECTDCGQRFKTRNTYKRHLKTRHNKVLMITGELIHLSEEEARRPKTKSRRKKPSKASAAAAKSSTVATTAAEATLNETTETALNDDSNQVFFKQEQDDLDYNDNNAQEEFVANVYVYDEQGNEEAYTLMDEDDQESIQKTDQLETEGVEHNFTNNEVVIAQSDSNGALHYEYTQEEDGTVFMEGAAVEYTEERVVEPDLSESAKQDYEPHEETIVPFAIDDVPHYEEKRDENAVESVFMLGNQEEIVATEEVTSTVEEEVVSSTEVEIQTEEQVVPIVSEEILPMEAADAEDQNVIIPCQVKLCENNGISTLQLIKNSQLARLGSKAQSINLIQNGKQQTYLLLASDDDGPLCIANDSVLESKSLPVQPVIAGSAAQ